MFEDVKITVIVVENGIEYKSILIIPDCDLYPFDYDLPFGKGYKRELDKMDKIKHIFAERILQRQDLMMKQVKEVVE